MNKCKSNNFQLNSISNDNLTLIACHNIIKH